MVTTPLPAARPASGHGPGRPTTFEVLRPEAAVAVNATPESSPPWVLDFADGDRSMADLLGGKGANLAEMTRLGLPVPHGFIVITVACREFLALAPSPHR